MSTFVRPALSRFLRLAFAVSVAVLIAAPAARAAQPAAATLSEDVTQVSWTGGPLTSTQSADCGGPNSPDCDNFALNVLPPSYGFAVEITLTPTGADDYDLQVWGPDGNLVGSSGNSPGLAETVILANPEGGTYTVSAAPYLVLLPYSATATLVEGADPPPPPGPSTERPPTYVNYTPPAGMGTNAGEPTLGVNLNTGATMFIAGLETLKVDFDGCASPQDATWSDVSFLTTGLTTFDPILWTDQELGRTFVSQLLPSKVSLMAFTDDDGATWTPSQGAGFNSGLDHQGIGGGPFADGGLLGPLTEYENTVYYCSQDVALAQCASSLDGGLTFGLAVPIYNLTECGGLHGHPKVAPDGTVYVPNKNCNGEQGLARSDDSGLTWSVRTVPGTSGGETDPSVAIGAGGTVYIGMAGGDGRPTVAVSSDRGETWANIQDVGTDFKIRNTVFPVMIAGDDDRAAFAFLGTEEGGNAGGDDPGYPGVWHLYVSHTYDGGATWKTVNATPGDPVQRGTICTAGTTCGGTRNLLDFMDVTVDGEGRVLVGYADGCLGSCIDSHPNSGTELATIARQVSGKRLYAAFDDYAAPEPANPSAELATGGGVEVSWAEPEDNGSSIHTYRVYRRDLSGGASQLLATLGGTARGFYDPAGDGGDVYSVTAENAAGTSSVCVEASPVEGAITGPEGDPCELPGVTVTTDPPGDVALPGSAEHDLLSVSVAEPYVPGAADQLVFTTRVDNLESLPLNSIWRTVWIGGGGVTYFVDLRYTDPLAGVECNYGFLDGNIFSSQGDADGCSFSADGTLRVSVTPDKVGSPAAGDALAGLHARSEVLVGILGTGLLQVVDETAAGSHVLVGNASCANEAPRATADVATTGEDVPVTLDLLANDVDPDGDALTVSAIEAPANGAITDHGDGTVTYLNDAGFSGVDSFTYTVSDTGGGSDTATVTVTVEEAGNQPPVAVDDVATTFENKPVHVAALANDSDPEGDPIAVSAITAAANGRVVAKKNGTLSYKPDKGFVGTDAFTYTVTDGQGNSDTAVVTVTVDLH